MVCDAGSWLYLELAYSVVLKIIDKSNILVFSEKLL